MTNEAKTFCAGFGIGVAAAFFLAPRSGRDTRQYLQDKADEGADFIKRQGQDLADGAADLVDRGAKAVRHQKESVMAAVAAGRDAFRNGENNTPQRDYQL
jgi:gas vesicle protein